MSSIDREQIDALQRLLGRPVGSDEGSCAGFAQLTEANIQDIARLAHSGARLYSILYVRYLIGRAASLRNAMTFVDRVIVNKVEISDWLENHFIQE